MLASTHSFANSHSEHLQSAFAAVMPQIERAAHIYFRCIRCPQKREDAVAETVAIAWKWFVHLAQKGKDAAQFVSALASLAARSVRNGRRLCGQEKAKDALSWRTQQRHGFSVQKLPEFTALSDSPFEEALRDNTQTEVPEQVAFRVDFPRWRSMFCARDRRLIDELMVGERTQDAARHFGLTTARISQMRREFRQDWLRFTGEGEQLSEQEVASVA